jgi:hypothetical protein
LYYDCFFFIFTFKSKENGANQDITDNEGIPMLHQAILRQSNEAALFLLNQNVDINAK